MQEKKIAIIEGLQGDNNLEDIVLLRKKIDAIKEGSDVLIFNVRNTNYADCSLLGYMISLSHEQEIRVVVPKIKNELYRRIINLIPHITVFGDLRSAGGF